MSNKKVAISNWSKSKAKELLFQDLVQGKISLEGVRGDAKDVYAMHVEYGGDNASDFKKFASRLRATRKQVKQLLEQAASDSEAFNHDMNLYPERATNYWGELRWDGSAAQHFLRIDIAEKKHIEITPKELYNQRIEYQEYPLDVFRGHIYQEEKKQKFLNQYKSSKQRV